uniref:Photosystem II core complex proteins psbY, chloroplastic n=1 Tax=Anthurium amnicola TaxID=1678845 RepID=A0A1D1XL20_9ARAE
MPWSSPFANSPTNCPRHRIETHPRPSHRPALNFDQPLLRTFLTQEVQKATIFMATISAMAVVLSAARSMSIKSPRPAVVAAPPAMRPTSLQNLPRGLTLPKLLNSSSSSAALAGAVFSTLSTADAAFAAQQIADIAEGDNRGLALLIPIIPAILWVLYNILQPALNQLNRMRSEKSFVIGLGLGGGLAATGLLSTPFASALQQVADVAESSGDNRGLALLIPIIPAILWVLYNILQPALNQINRMRSG